MREHTGEPRSGPQHHVRRLIHGANGLGTDQGLGRGETKPRNASGHRGDLGLPDHLAFRATHIHDVGNHIDGHQRMLDLDAACRRFAASLVQQAAQQLGQVQAFAGDLPTTRTAMSVSRSFG